MHNYLGVVGRVRKAHVAVVAAVVVGLAAGWGIPSSAASQALYHAPAILLPHSDVASMTGWTASNWSGYAISGSGYHQITGHWTVPAVSATTGASYSASWIGIDGFSNNSTTIIQTGTEQNYVSGIASYAAWWEIYPAAETVIPTLAIHPGDRMSASIVQGSGSSWTITIADTTTRHIFTTTQTYTGPGTSAEWIQEAPTIGGRVAALAHYGKVTFDRGTVNGTNPGLTAADGGNMMQSSVIVSSPSLPDSDTDGFNMAYGSTAPAAPGS